MSITIDLAPDMAEKLEKRSADAVQATEEMMRGGFLKP